LHDRSGVNGQAADSTVPGHAVFNAAHNVWNNLRSRKDDLIHAGLSFRPAGFARSSSSVNGAYVAMADITKVSIFMPADYPIPRIAFQMT
jgi:hypothetical protein